MRRDEHLCDPQFINFDKYIKKAVLVASSANFTRSAINSNIEIDVPLGSDISPGAVWMSPNVYLPVNAFNSIRTATGVTYPSGNSLLIEKQLLYVHDVLIHYKISKSDGNNFLNRRDLRCALVSGYGSTYGDATAYKQPTTGEHDMLHIKCHIEHDIGDEVYIRFNLAQDNYNADKSSTLLTILRISWNLLGLDHVAT